MAQRSFEAPTAILEVWLATACGSGSGVGLLFEDLWAVLHGMSVLHLDRSAPLDMQRAKDCVSKLLVGTREQALRARK